jgi:hypothetical protein
MSPIVSAGMKILEAHPDPQALRELLSIQHTWEQEEARKAYERAMVALKRELPTVIMRDKTVDFTNKAGNRTYYTHASLAAAMDAVTEPLTRHGISLSWKPSTARGNVQVTCRVTHVEGHTEETSISAPVDTSGNKGPAQGVASTITLLQRYTALSLLGIATADMDDPPQSAADPDAPNPQRALRAIGHITRKGRTKADAEGHVGRPVEQWTNVDIDELNEWLKRGRRED